MKKTTSKDAKEQNKKAIESGPSFFEKVKFFTLKNKILLLSIVAAIVIISSFCFINAFSLAKNILKINTSKASLFGQIQGMTASSVKKLKGEKEGRTNILLLGMGGADHSGALLTDTIMLVSIKYEENNNKKIALISLPRDLYLNLNNQNGVKINSVYELGENNNHQGDKMISKIVSNITDLPIHYYLRADFEGFQKAIDILNGVDIYIERSFYDPMYPTDDFGYQTITFNQGLTHMDGDTALKYVRSRHGIVIDNSGGYEASDFARANRQQQLLYAIKEKVLSVNTIANPKKINELSNAFGDHIRTNLELWEMLKLTNTAKNINISDIENKVIDDSPSGLLYATSAPDGSFILLPKSNNFSEIQDFCQNIFNAEEIKKEISNIEILNGTTIPSLTAQAAAKITYENMTIINLQNASKQNYEKTTLYDFSNNTKSKTIKFLKNRFNAEIIKTAPPIQNLRYAETKPDIVLVIGKNFLNLPQYVY